MTEFDFHKVLALPMIVSLCLCVSACGGTSKGARSATDGSLSTAVPSSTTATNSSAAPTWSNITGDYDPDDHNKQAGDGDNDDNNKPKDRDGDSDNGSNSYYDGDDNAVRRFGHAASAVDTEAVTTVVKRYFGAAAAEDGATACPMIVSSLAEAVPEDLGRPPGPPYASGKTCAEVLSKVFKYNHRQLAAYAARLEVTGVRLDRNHGVAVLGFRTLPGRLIHVVRESGVWKINTLLDSELP